MSCRVDGDQVDLRWPPSSVNENGQTVTYNVLRTDQPAGTKDEWLQSRGKFNPDQITTWDPILDCDVSLVRRRILEHCNGRAIEIGCPVNSIVAGSPHHNAVMNLATFLWDHVRLDDPDYDWRKNKDEAERGYHLQQEWRKIMYGNARRPDGTKAFDLSALRPHDDPLYDMHDDLTKALLKQNDEYMKKRANNPRLPSAPTSGPYNPRFRNSVGTSTVCYECLGPGHIADKCPYRRAKHAAGQAVYPSKSYATQPTPQGPRPAPSGSPAVTRNNGMFCTYCQRSNHTIDRCFLNPASPNFRPVFRPGGSAGQN